MTKIHTEAAFESVIEAHLLAHGYEQGNPKSFDAALGLDPVRLTAFIAATQPKIWAAIETYYGNKAAVMLLDDLTRALASVGMLHVLRHGFNCFGKTLRVEYFAPANVLTVTWQVHHSPAHPE